MSGMRSRQTLSFVNSKNELLGLNQVDLVGGVRLQIDFYPEACLEFECKSTSLALLGEKTSSEQLQFFPYARLITAYSGGPEAPS